MHWIDWLVLSGTLILISWYGVWKTRNIQDNASYLGSGRTTPWWAIGLSIMATQASAITFISTPGMGYESGLGFVQFYFGLPIAMVIIAYAFVPVYHRLKVFTAFQFLEERFGMRTRLLTAFLFLVQRGLAAGLTIYAPSIILSKIVGIPLQINILIIGILVIIYTVSGGTEAVTQTHKQQMAVIFIGLFVAAYFLISGITEHVPVSKAISIANWSDKLHMIDTDFRLDDRYNLWSGLIAGTFLMLSYFGTDQSQVQRYLSGRSLKEIRTGLYFNAILKIPMQLFILMLGVFVFVFYQFNKPPAHFDQLAVQHVLSTEKADSFNLLNHRYDSLYELKRTALESGTNEGRFRELQSATDTVRREISTVIRNSDYASPVKKQSDFVFITFILQYLPIGIIGLLMAVIFSAAMSSTAAELNALGTTTVVDFYERLGGKSSVRASRFSTAAWGVIAIIFALIAQFMDNLVEAVNILGSLFYGTVLGIFLVAFYVKRIGGFSVFAAAIISELVVLALFYFDDLIVQELHFKVEFLWYNLIGCVLVMALGYLIEMIRRVAKGS
ncbi:MAG: sodium:solute symporter [Flavobacteriales bacterium]|nr:sodium:solute symporter [Bacteroidota bacterium]MCB9241356.1 sodium:solute symporter [Flavobacteriales bacterium]